MQIFKTDNLTITTNKAGSGEYSKVSYPLRYGRFSEIETPEHTFQFNANGEIKFISGRTQDWPDPSEWLKRTIADDWIYYSTGGYRGVYDSLGEYYLPCLSYPGNSINITDPFKTKAVKEAINSWKNLHKKVGNLYRHPWPEELRALLYRIKECSPRVLKQRAKELHGILGDRITVLPPDSRHVDYDIIPIIIADGCLYDCSFCRIKTGKKFKNRSIGNIKEQVKRLKEFFGRDAKNYNSIFLGQHDALNGGRGLIEFAAEHAYNEFQFEQSNMKGSNLFLFGSVDSLINAEGALFDWLETLPYSTYINIGLESADRETLVKLGKPVTPRAVYDAFSRMVEINKQYKKIEITGNFILSDNMPEGHFPSFFRLMETGLDNYYPKGTIYFSPLIGAETEEKRGIKRKFYKIKTRSRLPTFLYLIQRL